MISATIVILWLVPELVSVNMAGTNGAGFLGYFSIIALLLTIIAPLVYGWYSRDETGAILVGALPILLITGVFRVITENDPAESGYLIYSIVYIALLCMVGGLEGYFAAKKTAGSLLIALLLAGIWTGIFFCGIR